jgi:predicted enzyme related to lactoylglutathione lyase
MARSKKSDIGTIAWRDLTVQNATKLRDFYARMVGWKFSPVDMGGYSDFCMLAPATGETVAGICHARGSNADLPAQWLIYIVVADVDRSAAKCRKLGGKVLVKPRPMAGGRFCVIRDPAGAVCALYRPPR